MIRDAMINRTQAEWDALEDAIGTLWGWMKEGHVIRAQDVADFTLIDKCQREDEEAATDAYHRGYEDGLRERGGDELVRLAKAADEARIESSTARTMEALAHRRTDLAEDEAASWKADAAVTHLENVRLREALEDAAYQFAYAGTHGGAPALITGGLSTLEEIFDLLGWKDPHPTPDQKCDEPGCANRTTCGAPTPEGYRRVCGDHYREIHIARAALTTNGTGQ